MAWPVYPIVPFVTLRTKASVEQIFDAYKERILFFRSNTWYNDGYTIYNLPVFWYTWNTQVWDATHPNATPAKWPPFQSPDNEFRIRVPYGLRAIAVGGHGSSDWGGYATSWDLVGDSAIYGLRDDFCLHFINQDEGLYRGYEDVEAFLTHAIGHDWTDKLLWGDPPANVRAAHISEVIKAFSKMIVAPLFPHDEAMKYKLVSVTNANFYTAWADVKTAFNNASWVNYPYHGVGLRSSTRKSGDNYFIELYGYKCDVTIDLDVGISGMDWNVVPPLSAKLITAGYLPPYEGHTGVSGICLQCITTGDKYSVPEQNADGRGYVINADITDRIGSGHGSEKFEFTTYDDFSNTELEKVKPAVPTTSDYKYKGAHVSAGNVWTQNSPVTCFYVAIEPDWGRGPLPT